jgi:GNAT superfamily N-acetyltransferase
MGNAVLYAPAMISVRRGVEDDRDAVIAMLGRAFTDDPFLRFFFPTDAEYAERAPVFFGLLFDIRIESGRVDVTEDLSAAALWNPPGGIPDTPELEQRWTHFAETGSEEEHERFLRFGEAQDRYPPPPGAWYLGILGVEPSRQQSGLGTAVLDPVLDKADDETTSVYLETGTQANIAFYGPLGFRVRAEFDVPGGPHVWGMWRAARPY